MDTCGSVLPGALAGNAGAGGRQRGGRGREGRDVPGLPRRTGNSANPEWPSLAGLGADYIAEQLQNFKDGKRTNPIMTANVLRR